MRRRCAAALAMAIVAGSGIRTTRAQSIADIGARIAPQYHSYNLRSPSSTTISEFSLPLYAAMPLTPSFSVDLGTAWVDSRVTQSASGGTAHSNISGLTDTQLRGTYVFGTDFIVITGGVNLPTGQSTVTQQQALAASLIGSDFLAFPISNMGTGFGVTAGVALARPLGDWNVGGGASVKRSSQYDPIDAVGGPTLHYQPGNEYRLRAGLDRGVGTGHVALGLTYSRFGDDNLGGSIYNTGDRYLTTFSYDTAARGGTLTVSAWNLFRAGGTIADGTFLGHENIGNVGASYGVPAGRTVVEPNIEGRLWTQSDNAAASALTTVGVRLRTVVNGFVVLPGVGYSLGRVAAQDDAGLNGTAGLSGWHLELAVRLR